MKYLFKIILVAFIIHAQVPLFYIFREKIFYISSGYLGLSGAILYFFVYTFWAYVVVVFLYGKFCRKPRDYSQRLVFSYLFGIICYLGMRIPHMMDNDFWVNFSIWQILGVISSSTLLVVLWEKIYPKIATQQTYVK